MKTIRTLAAGLLLLTGLLHVIQIITATGIDSGIIITVAFGIIYLVLGLLLRRISDPPLHAGRVPDQPVHTGRTILWLAAIIPLVGLLLAGVGMLTKPTLMGALFMVIDIGISTCCFILIFHKVQKEIPA
jgi:hypothetical protein